MPTAFLCFESRADDFIDSLRVTLHRFFLVLRNNNLDSIIYLNTNLHLSLVAILDPRHTLEDHRILIRSMWWALLNPSLRILCLEDRGGCEHLQLTGRRGVVDRLAKLGRTLALMVEADRLKAQMNPCLMEGPEEGVRLGCRMMSGRDSGKITM
jgi:hypothetical protein